MKPMSTAARHDIGVVSRIRVKKIIKDSNFSGSSTHFGILG